MYYANTTSNIKHSLIYLKKSYKSMEKQAPVRLPVSVTPIIAELRGLVRKSVLALAVTTIAFSPLSAKAWWHGRDDDDRGNWHPHPFFHLFIQPPPIFVPPPVYYNPPIIYANPPQYYPVPQPPPVTYRPFQPAQPQEPMVILPIKPNGGTTENGKFHAPKGCFAYPILNHTEYFVNCKGGVHFTVKAK